MKTKTSHRFIYSNQFRSRIENCKTPNQVLKLLEHYEIPIIRDTTDEIGRFSVWIADDFRIYQNYTKQMICQKWQEVDMTYSGVPTYPSARQ
jgi:hypothetical protein